MHILVINDDGPPSNQSSPYVHSFIHYLQEAGHLVSVVLPHQQRSWIGKAHFVGQLTKPTYFHPGAIHNDDGTTHAKPSSNANQEEWILVDGTPATCAQLGLHHFFQNRPPVDLVVSGPNYGRNSTSLFSLSSGTIGGAMEAAVLQKRAIALSFAFWSRDHQPDVIAGACKHSIRLIEYLTAHWGNDVDLYSINVPLIKDVASNKIMYTHALQNYWTSGSSFQEVEPEDDVDPQEQEKMIRTGAGDGASSEAIDDSGARSLQTSKHKWFKWAPKFGDVQKSIDSSAPGNDGWAVHQGYTSVTPLKANYMHATDIPLGELKLDSESTKLPITLSPKPIDVFATISADSYTAPLINEALKVVAPHLHLINVEGDFAEASRSNSPSLQIMPYEEIDFEHHLRHPKTSLANSYVIRKALIRKHYMWSTICSWWSKHPDDTSLKNHVPLTVTFELDYAEFLEDMLVECYELHESFAKDEREWWVLKPAMSDQGQGVRLFSSFEELQAIFDEWEPHSDDNDSEENSPEEEAQPPTTINIKDHPNTNTSDKIITSQLRHFIAQRYIDPPLLISEHNNRKFHIRSYVLAVGALKVYVYKEMLALFAPEAYQNPPTAATTNSTSTTNIENLTPNLDPRIHLTNTCLHTPSSPSFPPNPTPTPNVLKFSTLPLSPPLTHTHILTQMYASTSTLFLSATSTPLTFQALPNSFEIFGLDWLVDEGGEVWLLEVNAFPDFKQTGGELRDVVRGLWEGVVREAVVPFFCGGVGEGKRKAEREGEKGEWREEGEMVKVLDVDLGRG